MITYRLALILLSPVILAHLLWKSIQARQVKYLKQRLGFGFNLMPLVADRRPVWFHCASVGETSMILPLIDELHNMNSSLCFLVTTNTVTGASIITRQDKPYINHIYMPLYWVSSTRRFIKTFRPATLYIVETELWPNLIDECRRAKIITHIINGRLSPKTTQTNRWLSSLYASTLKKINHIYTRSDIDREHFIQLGSSEDHTTTIGNLKYASSNRSHRPQDLTKRPYILAASTHDDEELQITRSWLDLKREELLVFAPRHPERKAQIIEQLKPLTEKIATRSDNSEITDDTRIYILDTVGELVSWFITARVVIMGGSFVNRGGHNVIEPAQQGKAIIYGPHMENFQLESRLLLDNEAAIQVKAISELGTILQNVLDDEATRSQLEKRASDAVKPFETILNSYADIVLRHQDETYPE